MFELHHLQGYEKKQILSRPSYDVLLHVVSELLHAA